MRLCSNCKELKHIPENFDELDLGSIGGATTDYMVYLNNLTMNKNTVYPVTSTAGSKLVLSTDDESLGVVAGHLYEIFVVDAAENNMTNKETLTIGGTEATCLLARFHEVRDSLDHGENFTAITAEIND